MFSRVWKIFNFASVRQSSPRVIRSCSNRQASFFGRSVVWWTTSPNHCKSLRRGKCSSCNNASVNMNSAAENVILCNLEQFWKEKNKVNRLLPSSWEDVCGKFYWKCFNAVTAQWGMCCNWAESSRNPLLQEALVTSIVCILWVRIIRFLSIFFPNMFWQSHFFLFIFEETSLSKGGWITLSCLQTGKPININYLPGLKDGTKGYILISHIECFFIFFYLHIYYF